MSSFFKKLFKGDTTIWIVYIALCIGSIIIMYSASSTLAYKAANYSAPVIHHARYLILGIVLAYGIHFIPYKYIRILSYGGLILSIFLLILVLFRGTSENDATRWLSLFGIQFQPSEIAKLSLIIVVADFISRIKDKDTERKYFWWTLGATALICFLILLENFSTAVLLFAVIYLMMFISGKISLKRLSLIFGSIVVVSLLGYFTVKSIPADKMPRMLDRSSTWVARIDRFMAGDEDEQKYVITDNTLQQKRASIAIANGGITGVGAGNSVQRDYLPQAYSDFIYAIIVEEGGLIIGVLVIFAYLILLFRAGIISKKCTTVFPAVLVIGLSLIICLQAFISMAVATGLGPVTGQPLPLISRGGTSIAITSVYFGIILGVTRSIKQNQNKGSVEENDGIPVIELEEL